jgi:hypothetical protein
VIARPKRINAVETKISEIADGIYRLSTYVPDIAPPAGFTFNQFLVLGDEPLMFHTGLRKMFPLNLEATQLGNERAMTDGDVVGPAIAAEDIFKYSSLSPGMGSTIRSLSGIAPRTLALMHGPAFMGDGAAALEALADQVRFARP